MVSCARAPRTREMDFIPSPRTIGRAPGRASSVWRSVHARNEETMSPLSLKKALNLRTEENQKEMMNRHIVFLHATLPRLVLRSG